MLPRPAALKRLLLVCAVLVTPLLAIGARSVTHGATAQLDQSVVAPAGTAENSGVNAGQFAAQTFTAGRSGCLTQVALAIWLAQGDPGPLTVQLVTVDASSTAPTSTVLAQTTVPASAFPGGGDVIGSDGNYIFTPATFTLPAAITAGSQYALVLSSANGRPSGDPSVPGGWYSWAVAGTAVSYLQADYYPGGHVWYDAQNGGWQSIPGYPKLDMQFQTYVQPCSPVLNSLSPASAVAGGAAFTLMLTGQNFTGQSAANWTVGTTTTTLPTTFVSATQLQASVTAAAIATPVTAEIAVLDAAAGTSSSLPFYVTQTSATVTASAGATSTTAAGTAVATLGGSGAGTPGSITASATGAGTVDVASYSADPGAPPTGFSSIGGYYDISTVPGSSFSSLTISDCGTGLSSGTVPFWYNPAPASNPAGWTQVSDYSFDPTSGCLTITVNGGTSPNLSQLTGTYVAAGVPCTRPGNGNGDKNHVHCGPPGQDKSTSPGAQQGRGPAVPPANQPVK